MDATNDSEKKQTNDLLISSSTSLQRLDRQKMKSKPDEEKLLLLGGRIAPNSVQKFHKGTWQKCADSLKHIDQSAIASNDTHVFVVDGFDRVGHIQMYDIYKDTWSIAEDTLKIPRSRATATIIDSKLFLFGGFGMDYLTSTEVFTISGSSCEPCESHDLPDLKVKRCDHASVTRNNKVYFIGGTSSRGRLSFCESMNVVTGESVEFPPLHQARSGMSAVLFNNNVVVMGGCGENRTITDSVETYSFDIKQWTMMEAMTTPRYQHCAVIYKDELFVMGGQSDYCDNESCTKSIEVYDPDTKKWKISRSLFAPVPFASVIKLNRNLTLTE